jgi:hypothetical protein
MTGLYVVEILLNLTRPKVLPNEPTLTIFSKVEGDGSLVQLLNTPRLIFWLVIIGIVAGVVLQVAAFRQPPGSARERALTWATLGALVGPFALIPLQLLIFVAPLPTIACIPGTVVVLWLLHNVQRFVRLPGVMLVAGLLWGALIAWGFTRACTNLAFGTVNGYVTKSAADDASGNPLGALSAMTGRQYDVIDYMVIHLAVIGQLTIGAGILLVLLLFRHRITDAVSGAVVGAAAGLGYTFVESVIFIKMFSLLSRFNGATSGFEYWIRQSATLLTGRVAFGALLGAALGVAAALRTSRERFSQSSGPAS